MKRLCLILLGIIFIKPCWALDRTLFAEVYNVMPSLYLYDLSVEEIAVTSLKKLNEVDRGLVFADDDKRLSLYYKAKLVKSYSKPENKNDVEAWANVTQKFGDLALQYSPIAAQKEYEMNDIVLEAAIPAIDKSSKYYSGFVNGNNKRIKHKRNFASRMIEDVLYIKSKSINNSFASDVETALGNNPDSTALILDLRGNSGGALDQAVKAADLFLDGGIITSVVSKKGSESTFYRAEDGEKFSAKPILIMVDDKTASSAEAFAAALQSQGRAKLIGATTMGKSSVQEVAELIDGSSIAVTSAFFNTPAGIDISVIGLIPDICLNGDKVSANPTCLKETRAKNSDDIHIAMNEIRKILLK